MPRKSTSPDRPAQRPTRFILIAGGMLLLVVALFFIVRMLVGDRGPETASPREDPAVQQADDRGASPGASTVFRDDAQLSFLSPTGEVRATVRVEIADNEATRTQGLMGRTQMAEDQGMLFIFPDEEFRSFWMANTPLPLDIIFVNAAREIVTIQRDAVPYSEASVPSTGPATYVVEVNAGYADRHGLAEGDRVQWQRK